MAKASKIDELNSALVDNNDSNQAVAFFNEYYIAMYDKFPMDMSKHTINKLKKDVKAKYKIDIEVDTEQEAIYLKK